MGERVQDMAILIGHAWRCPDCRAALVENPDLTIVGFKLSEDQRERIRELDDDSFQTMSRLSDATGLTLSELEAGIEHPRARLRHFGSRRGDYFSQSHTF
jgi:hypothetical protein